MADNTPDHRSQRAAKLKGEFDAALERAREAGELRDAAPDYDDDEPSQVTITGPAAEKFVARIRKDSPVPSSGPGPESIRVKAGKLLERRFGRTIAAIIVAALGAIWAAVWQQVGR
jgi:hypothetical protein